jgi:hypothetical protein
MHVEREEALLRGRQQPGADAAAWTGTGVAAGVTPTASVFATRRGDGRRIEQLLRREAHAELARAR